MYSIIQRLFMFPEAQHNQVKVEKNKHLLSLTRNWSNITYCKTTTNRMACSTMCDCVVQRTITMLQQTCYTQFLHMIRKHYYTMTNRFCYINLVYLKVYNNRHNLYMCLTWNTVYIISVLTTSCARFKVKYNYQGQVQLSWSSTTIKVKYNYQGLQI